MTSGGGASDLGTIFKYNLEEASLETLHEFAGPAADGSRPFGSVVLKNGILYGMTREGGAADRGTIFSYSMK